LSEKKQILKSASIISLITFASRILGYVRDQRITLLLGTTLSADSFVLAYRIPNLFRRLIGDGTFSATFIPVFTTFMRDRSVDELWQFANRLFWTVALVLAVVVVFGVIFSPQVIHTFTSPQDKAEGWDEAIALNRIIFPYLFFLGLTAIAIGILNSFHYFGLPSATSVLLNAVIIIFSTAAVWRYFRTPATSLAVGVLVGGALQFLMLVPQLVRRGMRFDFALSFTHPAIKDVARVLFPRFFGLGISQINFFVDTYFANSIRMPRGSLTALYVADRVMELMLGGYAIAVATAILPIMSHQAAANNYEGLKKTLTFAVRIVAYITVPAAIGLMTLREPIIRMLFQHGQFVAESTRLTARPLLYYAIGLPALACVKLIVPAFYSARDTKTPVIVALISFFLNIFLNIVFLQNFYLYKRFQNGGPALATAIATIFDFVILFAVFRLRYGSLGSFGILRSLGKISVCSLIMGVGCLLANHYANNMHDPAFFIQLVVFIAMILGATLVYIGLTWLFKCPEIEEVYGIAMRRPGAAEGLAGS
jgi:putative peptidoglycan lipid II flippase